MSLTGRISLVAAMSVVGMTIEVLNYMGHDQPPPWDAIAAMGLVPFGLCAPRGREMPVGAGPTWALVG
jgi:hypothetical protein